MRAKQELKKALTNPAPKVQELMEACFVLEHQERKQEYQQLGWEHLLDCLTPEAKPTVLGISGIHLESLNFTYERFNDSNRHFWVSPDRKVIYYERQQGDLVRVSTVMVEGGSWILSDEKGSLLVVECAGVSHLGQVVCFGKEGLQWTGKMKEIRRKVVLPDRATYQSRIYRVQWEVRKILCEACYRQVENILAEEKAKVLTVEVGTKVRGGVELPGSLSGRP